MGCQALRSRRRARRLRTADRVGGGARRSPAAGVDAGVLTSVRRAGAVGKAQAMLAAGRVGGGPRGRRPRGGARGEVGGGCRRRGGRDPGRRHWGRGGEDDEDDDDPAAAVHLLLAIAKLAAARLPAATLDAVGAGGVACPDDTRSAAVAMPAARGRRLTAAATATAAPGTPLTVAAATSPPHAAGPPATHRSASAAVASTAGTDAPAVGVGPTVVAAGGVGRHRCRRGAAVGHPRGGGGRVGGGAIGAGGGGSGGRGRPPTVRGGGGGDGNATPRWMACALPRPTAWPRCGRRCRRRRHRRRPLPPPRLALRVADDGGGADEAQPFADAGRSPPDSVGGRGQPLRSGRRGRPRRRGGWDYVDSPASAAFSTTTGTLMG